MRPRGSGNGEGAIGYWSRTAVALLVVIAPVALTAFLLGMLVDDLCRKNPV